MFHRSFSLRRLFALALLLTAFTTVTSLHAQDNTKRGRKYKMPPPTARVEVTVLRATNGKPVENAAVIFHPLMDGKDDGNMELKTNDDGKAVIDLLAIGSNVRLQVIAPGYQTYGEDYKVDKDNLTIEIKLKRPAEQYSVYKKSEGRAAPTAPADKAEKSKDSAPDSSPAEVKPETKPTHPLKRLKRHPLRSSDPPSPSRSRDRQEGALFPLL